MGKIGIATAVLAVFSVPLWIISLLFKRHAKELLRQQKYVAWLLQSRSPCVLLSCVLMVYGLYVISLDGHFWFATGLIWLLYAVTFCRRNIEKGFHYVRERELIYILSSVDILDGELRDEETFKDVKASTIKSAVKLCNKCANKAKCYGEEFKDITGEFLSQYNK